MVIGILAAITVVAYNGVQERARVTALNVAAKDYLKILRMYAVTNDDKPIVYTMPEWQPGMLYACLGDGYKADPVNSLDQDVCDQDGSIKNGVVSPPLNNLLKTVSNIPSARMDVYKKLATGGGSRGILLYSYITGGKNFLTIIWHNPPNIKCIDGARTIAETGYNYCDIGV